MFSSAPGSWRPLTTAKTLSKTVLLSRVDEKISEGVAASSAETGEHIGQSGLFPASTGRWTRCGSGGRLRTRRGLWSRRFGSAGQGGRLPGCGRAPAPLCLAAEAELVSVGGSFASVDVSSLLMVQFLLEEQGQSAVLLLLLLPAQLFLCGDLRRRRRGAGMKTRSFGRCHHRIV